MRPMFRLPATLLVAVALFAPSLQAQSPGAIVAVGGGGTTPTIVARTLELAGGPNAIVAVPASAGRSSAKG